ncbi:MAG: sigma-54-dependent Fis family transcriptional regulator [Ignavibacteriales bacterium]|nr:sigma-54-dependent Fis family transcriptional regulator [Ignavibacteriales bacterium]HPO54934.1 sigma-54 dependent transcriptional regulator [Ignavibacteriaceae bacterium]
MRIVVIDDEKIKRITMTDALHKAGYNVESFESPIAALAHVEKFGSDLVITDIRMPHLDGFEVLQKVKNISPGTFVVMITGYGTIQSAVEAMKLGAYDYLTKPFSLDHLLLLVSKVKHIMELERENVNLKEKLTQIYSFHNIIGKSRVMQKLFEQLNTISKTEMAVLIEGESGTGKEIVANAIHYNSPRKDKPFIKLSCAILNESLLESELFGHVKGAFTGAIKEKKGRFELANGGTLFLDDVDDIPLSFQVKLLRVLQEKEFEKVGGVSPLKTDVRIIAATKVNLFEKVEKGEFREDLFYRLKVIPLSLPPLRDRKEDIPLLLEHFAKKTGKNEVKFSKEALDVLTEYNWPGNVRQLENTFCRIIAFSDSNVITKEMLPQDILLKKINFQTMDFRDSEKISLDKLIEEVEASAISWAYKKSKGNQSQAAQLLGIKRTTFRDKLLKYDIK